MGRRGVEQASRGAVRGNKLVFGEQIPGQGTEGAT